MANFSLPGYPMPYGGKSVMVMDHTGPSSYQTGGEGLTAKTFGWGSFDWVQTAAYSLSGTYQVVVLYPVAGVLSITNVNLAWYATATGLQVLAGTDLSGEHVRVQCLGS